MTTVSLDVAQKTLSSLIDGVAMGEHVLITRDRRPIAELVPVMGRKSCAVFGSARGLVHMSPAFDDPLGDFQDHGG